MIKIIIDSLSGLTKDQAKKLGFGFLPISVIDKNKKYNDGIDIDINWILKKQLEGVILKTSQPSTQTIEDEISKYNKKYKQILIITCSSGISGTYSNAVQVAQKYTNVKVLDSLNGGHIITVLAMLAKKMLNNLTLDKAIKKLENLRSELFTYIIPYDVTYLARSGRISPTVAKFAKIIGITPIMAFVKGTIQKIDKSRSLEKSISKIYKHAKSKMGKVKEIALLIYGYNDGEKLKIKKLIEKKFRVKTVSKGFPTSVATHLGPKSIGITISKLK